MTRTVLITGCSSGVGRAATHTFLEDGWTVYATARDTDDLADLETAGATTAALDVTSATDADRVVDQMVAEHGRIDCLVNNAGFGQLGPLEDVSVEKVRDQYEVNTFGPHRLARAVLPHMREQGTGTILNVTSITARFAIAGSSAYSGSKAALAAASQALRQEVHEQGIDVVVIEPVVVATDFYDRQREELVDVDRNAAYVDLYEVLELLHTVKSGGPGIVRPETVAETMLDAANSPNPDRRYPVGWGAKAGAVGAAILPEPWRTPVLSAGVRLATTPPVRRFLQWWFGRHHQASDRQRD